MILVPKNWHSFQHYSKRNPPWIKLHKSLLDNFDYQSLPVASKALAPMLWLLASESLTGEIEWEPRKIAFRLRWVEADLNEAIKPLISFGFFEFKHDASALLGACKSDATPETETETETETYSETEAPPPSAPAQPPPLGGKKKKRRTRDPLPLGRVGGLALEAFEEAVSCWPVEITGFNERIRSNETRKISVGNIPQAQRNFLQLIEEGHATAQELYACAWVASNQWKRQGYLWVPHLSTFYGPEKETWVQFLPEARKVLAEQAAQEEMNHAV